jgi:hypothetical protein
MFFCTGLVVKVAVMPVRLGGGFCCASIYVGQGVLVPWMFARSGGLDAGFEKMARGFKAPL